MTWRPRRHWRDWQPLGDASQYIFPDECGVTTALLQRYAPSPRGTRLPDHPPCRHWQTHAVIAALRADGVGAPVVFDRLLDTNSFLTYVAGAVPNAAGGRRRRARQSGRAQAAPRFARQSKAQARTPGSAALPVLTSIRSCLRETEGDSERGVAPPRSFEEVHARAHGPYNRTSRMPHTSRTAAIGSPYPYENCCPKATADAPKRLWREGAPLASLATLAAAEVSKPGQKNARRGRWLLTPLWDTRSPQNLCICRRRAVSSRRPLVCFTGRRRGGTEFLRAVRPREVCALCQYTHE